MELCLKFPLPVPWAVKRLNGESAHFPHQYSIFSFRDNDILYRFVREVQALPLISANMTGGSGLNRMYTFHSNVMYVYVQVS